MESEQRLLHEFAMIEITSTVSIPQRELRFVYGTSTGPGGQHVNKVATKATLLFDIQASSTLSTSQQHRVFTALPTRINKRGVLRVSSSKYRSQKANRDAATGRFAAMIRDAITPKKRRKKSPIPRSSKRKRLETKRIRSETKRLRSRVEQNDH